MNLSQTPGLIDLHLTEDVRRTCAADVIRTVVTGDQATQELAADRFVTPVVIYWVVSFSATEADTP